MGGDGMEVPWERAEMEMKSVGTSENGYRCNSCRVGGCSRPASRHGTMESCQEDTGRQTIPYLSSTY